MRISSEVGIMREQAIALNENKHSDNSSFGKYSFLMNITYVIILSHLSKMPFNSISSAVVIDTNHVQTGSRQTVTSIGLQSWVVIKENGKQMEDSPF